jgi:hypothetical protein
MQKLLDDLSPAMAQEGAPKPDVILVTGDVACKGDSGEYDKAGTWLDRVLAIKHREEPDFAPLLECLAKARELRQRAAEIEFSGETDPPADVLEEVQSVADGHHPLCDLLAQVEEHDSLDDERWHDLTAHITRAFGKPLATAAARGKLQGVATEPQAPEAPVQAAPGSGAQAPGARASSPAPSATPAPAKVAD